jgi:pSer/pThr/pTyr-binding forkhead associated (FHA) protein
MSGILFLILRVLLAAVLYGFLGLALYILWKDMKQQREILAAQKAPFINLRIQGESTDETYQYKTREIFIGRVPSCELPLTSEKVSAHHARLYFHNNQWWIEDLNSTNGTFLNEERVSVPTVVVDGDSLGIGDVTAKISTMSPDTR